MASDTCPACGGLWELKTTSYNFIYVKALEGCPGCSLLLSVVLSFLDGQERVLELTMQPKTGVQSGPLLLQVRLGNGTEQGIELYRQPGIVNHALSLSLKYPLG
jgi:hypothetical protein